eukprot:11833054-Alexandrium_andersonii.AAC.1
MSASLVGSEMCIRDRRISLPHSFQCSRLAPTPLGESSDRFVGIRPSLRTVSYTHLTLPTICSV